MESLLNSILQALAAMVAPGVTIKFSGRFSPFLACL
jgi:hypothetical protein